MYLDRNLIVSGSIGGTAAAPSITGQTVTGNSAVVSTNTIDLLEASDIGEGDEFLRARANVTVAFTGLTALTIEAIQADDAALTSNVTVIGSSGAIPVASLTAGALFEINLNSRIASRGQRYLGLRYTPTGTGTAGAILGDFGIDIQDGRKFYPSGFTVL